MRTSFIAVVTGCLLWSTGAAAESVFVTWAYERALNPEAFLLTAEGAGGRVTWRTSPSAAGACPGEASVDTYCTQLRQCPPLGPTQFSVVAVVNGTPTEASAPPLACQVTSQMPCRIGCANPADTQPAGNGPLVQVPSTEAPANAWETTDGRVILDIPTIPTQDVVALPAVETPPALPLFQPEASKAPI